MHPSQMHLLSHKEMRNKELHAPHKCREGQGTKTIKKRGDAPGLHVLYLLYLPVVESAVQESECEIMTKLTISVSTGNCQSGE